jgi:hypothetical protein
MFVPAVSAAKEAAGKVVSQRNPALSGQTGCGKFGIGSGEAGAKAQAFLTAVRPD